MSGVPPGSAIPFHVARSMYPIIIIFLGRWSPSFTLGMSFLQVDPLRDCYLHFNAFFSPPAPRSCKHPEPHLPSIFLAFSVSKKSSWWDIEEWVWCQGCWEFPSKKAECILQKKGCARMGRTDGWTCRTSFSHKRSEHRKRSVAFLSFFLFESWNIFGKYLFKLQTRSNINKWKPSGRKKDTLKGSSMCGSLLYLPNYNQRGHTRGGLKCCRE